MEAMQGWIEKEGFITLVMSQQRNKDPTSKITLTLYDLPYFSLWNYNEKAKLKLREKEYLR
jgi:hypothetical protein